MRTGNIYLSSSLRPSVPPAEGVVQRHCRCCRSGRCAEDVVLRLCCDCGGGNGAEGIILRLCSSCGGNWGAIGAW